MCFFVHVNQKVPEMGFVAIILEVVKYCILIGIVTGFILASLNSTEDSSLIFRLAKPVIIDTGKALHKLVTDEKFYKPVLNIIITVAVLVGIFLLIQFQVLAPLCSEKCCWWEFMPDWAKHCCRGCVPIEEDAESQEMQPGYPVQQQPGPHIYHRPEESGNLIMLDGSRDGRMITPNAPGMSTLYSHPSNGRIQEGFIQPIYPTIPTQQDFEKIPVLQV